MAGHEWEGWFEREEFIGQISDIRVQNLQVEREVVQKRTFTRWINLHLEKCNPPTEVQDLFQDIQDGRILMALLEELSGCQLLHGFKKSSHRIFRLNNIAKVLTFLEERNVKLVSIDAADIADGNASIILGLLWNIILFFQIKELTGNIRSQFPSTSSLCSIPTSSDSDTSHSSTPSEELRGPPGPPGPGHGRAIKKLLQWVQKRTRKYGVAVQDFGKSWTSGLAFLAIIKSIDPSLVDMRRALLRTPRENLEEAFRTAHYTLGIPRLLEPEDVTISRPEEQCIMTYVSQFLEHFPGMDEPEQPSLVIERSVSMGRLNTRDLDQDHQIKNSLDRSRLKKRPHAVDQDRRRQPRAAPRVFLSSVSEDRGFVVSSLSHRPSRAGARSWASEDSLLDQVPAGDGEPQGPGEATTFTVSTSRAPRPSYVRSPLGSPAAAAGGEPVLGSPDSWQEESGLGESPSEGSLCDSCGTAWDVCAAVAAEEARAESPSPASLSADAPPDGPRTPEPFVDEGVGSLGSTESTKDRPEPCAAEADKGEDTGQDDLHVHGSHRAPVHVPEAKAGENKSEPEPEGTECSPIETAPDSVEEPPPLELCSRTETVISEDADSREHAEADRSQSELNKDFITSDPFLEITEPDSVEASGQKDTVCPKKASDLSAESEAIEGQLPTEKTLVRRESSLDNTEWEASCQGKYPLLEDRENTAESEETNNVDFKNSQTQGITNGRGFSGDADGNEHKGSETLGIHDDSHPAKMECPSDDVSQSESLCSSNPQPSQTGAMAPIEIVEGKEEAKSSCDLYFDLTSTVKAEVSSPAEATKMNQNGASTDPPDDCQETSTPASGPFVHPREDTDGRKGSDSGPAGASSRGPTADEDAKVDSFYTNMESSSPSEEPFGEALEPMDLFYPDKEDGMLAEPAEANTEFPPSVFGVFALQPAPPSEPLQPETDPTWEETDANPPTVSDQDSSSGGKMALGLMEEGNDRECDSRQPPGAAPILSSTAAMGGTASLEQEGPAEDGPLRGEEGGVRGHSVVKGNTEPTSGDEEHSRRPGDDLVPTVLRHRKANSVFTSSDKQRIVPIIQINSNTADLGEDSLDGREMYLLFLLWLLLYCLWLLPQMELRALPSLLFNLDP